MSIHEHNRRKTASQVFRKAWNLFKNGGGILYSFSECLRLAWALILKRQRLVFSKVRGVTFDNPDGISRQRLLQKLRQYPQADVSILLQREPDNPFDAYAIEVIASVRHHGRAVVGYMSSSMSREVSPLMDQGYTTVAFFEEITGGEILGLNYSFSLIPNFQNQNYCNKKEIAPMVG